MGTLSGKYADDMYSKWQKDPSGVHPSWAVLFNSGSVPEVSKFGAVSGQGQQALQAQGSMAINIVNLLRAYQVTLQ
jgi:2-oxoglutarate dehydrogenase complex dehydrogenase (E1) component-like enzyme